MAMYTMVEVSLEEYQRMSLPNKIGIPQFFTVLSDGTILTYPMLNKDITKFMLTAVTEQGG